MRIYTRGGDTGETGLGSGARVQKECARVEAYGTVDELNAHLGMARAAVRDRALAGLLLRLQSELFELGADLAAPPPADGTPPRRAVPRITDGHVTALEAEIDSLEAGLQPVSHFILPGGSAGAASLHVARCVCRRAERRLAALARTEVVTASCLAYLNRLSDLLFVMARAANASEGIADTPWEAPSADCGS